MATKSIFHFTEAELTKKGRSVGAIISSYFRLAIVKSLFALGEDKYHTIDTLRKELSDKINLSSADLSIIPGKDYSEFEYRLKWNLSRLKSAKLIEKEDNSKGLWKISINGIEFLNNFDLRINDEMDELKFKDAFKMIRNLAKENDGEEADESEEENINSDPSNSLDYIEIIESLLINIPRNKIYYGAPGTGKSFKLRDTVLNELKFKEENIKRITFHPSYSYQQFVGTYKPTPIYKTLINDPQRLYKSDKKSLLDGDEKLEPLIDYTFVAGPFLELLIEAIKAEKNNYMLIIEEINRANVASVFGDVFQLLDRKDNFTSEYEIDFNNDVRNYLISKGVLNSNGNEKIGLPKNFFIWGTMNNADQGVMPLDSAFKRRWAFEYIGINDSEKELNGRSIKFQNKYFEWNSFRKQVNSTLKGKVNDDKLLGPFFMNKVELLSSEAVKNKLLLYLREDVLRHNPEYLFSAGLTSFSEISDAYEASNEIFNLKFEWAKVLEIEELDSEGFVKEITNEKKERPQKTIDEHFSGTTSDFRNIFNELKEKIEQFGSDVKVRTTFNEIIFEDKTYFSSIYVSKINDSLRVHLRPTNNQFIDPKNLTEIIKTSTTGNSTRRLKINMIDFNIQYNLEDVLKIIKQAYDSK